MRLRLSVRWLAPLVVALAFALNLPRIIGGDASLPSWAPPARLEAIGSFAKLGSLLLGAAFGLRVAARLEKGNPARLAWLLLGLWLACFAAGQAVLMSYTLVLGREAPLPSLGDAGFSITSDTTKPPVARGVATDTRITGKRRALRMRRSAASTESPFVSGSSKSSVTAS